jgi:hypothetical protein
MALSCFRMYHMFILGLSCSCSACSLGYSMTQMTQLHQQICPVMWNFASLVKTIQFNNLQCSRICVYKCAANSNPSYSSHAVHFWATCLTQSISSPDLIGYPARYFFFHIASLSKLLIPSPNALVIRGSHTILMAFKKNKENCGLSPQANYIDRETAACRRSRC